MTPITRTSECLARRVGGQWRALLRGARRWSLCSGHSVRTSARAHDSATRSHTTPPGAGRCSWEATRSARCSTTRGSGTGRRGRRWRTSGRPGAPVTRSPTTLLAQRVVLFGGRNASALVRHVGMGRHGVDAGRGHRAGGPQRHALAYDSGRSRVVLFGGEDAAFAPLGDTWEWDGDEWTQVADTGPAPRAGHAMCFDAPGARTTPLRRGRRIRHVVVGRCGLDRAERGRARAVRRHARSSPPARARSCSAGSTTATPTPTLYRQHLGAERHRLDGAPGHRACAAVRARNGVRLGQGARRSLRRRRRGTRDDHRRRSARRHVGAPRGGGGARTRPDPARPRRSCRSPSSPTSSCRATRSRSGRARPTGTGSHADRNRDRRNGRGLDDGRRRARRRQAPPYRSTPSASPAGNTSSRRRWAPSH